mgnify:CR=1 FL=1
MCRRTSGAVRWQTPGWAAEATDEGNGAAESTFFGSCVCSRVKWVVGEVRVVEAVVPRQACMSLTFAARVHVRRLP